jgi:hypothetical protein
VAAGRVAWSAVVMESEWAAAGASERREGVERHFRRRVFRSSLRSTLAGAKTCVHGEKGLKKAIVLETTGSENFAVLR